jgi:hypothetical protein
MEENERKEEENPPLKSSSKEKQSQLVTTPSLKDSVKEKQTSHKPKRKSKVKRAASELKDRTTSVPSYPKFSTVRDDVIVYLNIGGYKYTTKKSTLCDCGKPNYFTSLLDGLFPITRDSKGYIFIDRPGKYFEPILEYLLTGDINIPSELSIPALVKEAAFYCIDFPLNETHESLSFVTDSWLLDRFENRAYLKISSIADSILVIVLKQFKEHADKSKKIETRPFLINDQTPVNNWLDRTEYGRDYKRFEFIDEQKKLYSLDGCIVNDEYFTLLDDAENRTTIINYCQHNDLTVDIVPVTISVPGVSFGNGSFTLGYKFIHLGSLNSDYKNNRHFHSRKNVDKIIKT